MAGGSRSELAERIRAMLAEHPLTLHEVLRRLEDENYRTVLQAWGDLRARVALVPDNLGRYRLPWSREGRITVPGARRSVDIME